MEAQRGGDFKPLNRQCVLRYGMMTERQENPLLQPLTGDHLCFRAGDGGYLTQSQMQVTSIVDDRQGFSDLQFEPTMSYRNAH